MRNSIPRNFWLVALVWLLFVKLVALAAPVTTDPKPAPPTAAEKARKALEQSITMEFTEQSLLSVLNQLSERTQVKFALDRAVIAQMGFTETEMPVSAKLQDTKLRAGLRTILSQYNLGYVILEDSVLVTTEEMAMYRQLRQRVNVDIDQPLETALKQLARRCGCNLILDGRVGKEAKETRIALQLEDVPLETAVRLIATTAGLKSVRLDNVIYVTTKERADELRAEPESRPPGVADGINPGIGLPVVPPKLFPPAPPGIAPAPPAPAPVQEKEAPKPGR